MSGLFKLRLLIFLILDIDPNPLLLIGKRRRRTISGDALDLMMLDDMGRRHKIPTVRSGNKNKTGSRLNGHCIVVVQLVANINDELGL